MPDVTIENVTGSSKDELPEGVSWIQLYTCAAYFRGIEVPKKCSKCDNRDFEGCHVEIVGKPGKIYIVPLCHDCNMKKETMTIDENLLISRDCLKQLSDEITRICKE